MTQINRRQRQLLVVGVVVAVQDVPIGLCPDVGEAALPRFVEVVLAVVEGHIVPVFEEVLAPAHSDAPLCEVLNWCWLEGRIVQGLLAGGVGAAQATATHSSSFGVVGVGSSHTCEYHRGS